MTLGPVRVMGAGVVMMLCVEEVTILSKIANHNVCCHYCMYTVCYAPLNGQVDCGSGLVNMGVEGDNCTFSCDPGYMLQGNVTSGTCENTGSWSKGLPFCVPLYCPDRSGTLQNIGAVRSSPCSRQYQTQCTASCDEGFTGDDVTYLCNVTSDPTMVNWVPIGGEHVMCERGLLA